MDRIKTFAKYAIWIILFWIFSDVLINVAINSTYKDIEQVGTAPTGIQVVEVKATAVNGKVNLLVNDESLSGKYVRIDLYSSIDNSLGTQYIEIGNVQDGDQKEISTYFKVAEAKKYEITIVDEEGESSDIFLDKEVSKLLTVIGVIGLLIF